MTNETPDVLRMQVSARTNWWWLRWLAAAAFIAGAGAIGIHFYAQRAFHSDPAPSQRTPRNAPFITSPDVIVNKMVELGRISEQDLVYDLGCGDGRIVITAAVQRGCRGVGFDIDPVRVAEAVENAQLHGVEHLVTIKQQDLFEVDLREAQVIVMYLLPWMIEKLTPQFERCPPGTRIISHDFKLEGIDDQEVAIIEDLEKPHYVYAYVTPLKRSAQQPKWKNWKEPAS